MGKSFLLTALCLFVVTATSSAMQRSVVINDRQTRLLVNRIEQQSSRFRSILANALDRSALNGTVREDEINRAGADFERTATLLNQNFDNRRLTQGDVEQTLRSAQVIDSFMRSYNLAGNAENRWVRLRNDLNALARTYSVAWNWFNPANNSTRHNLSDAQMRYLLSAIETDMDRFSRVMPAALDRSSLNNTAREDEINRVVTDFEYATDQLKQRSDNQTPTSLHVQTVLQRAAAVDDAMRRNRFGNDAEQSWRAVRRDLNQLAAAYNLNRPWDSASIPMQSTDSRFTGTYQLNSARSENPRTVAERALRNAGLGNDARNRIYNNLVTRLEAPGTLALARNGNQVTLASSRSPQVTLDVTGREYLERYPDGRTSHVRATFSNNQLTVISNGNRPNDFKATFQPLQEGRRLLVTREIYVERLREPVRLSSYYDRISDEARFDVDQFDENRSRDFIVGNGTSIVAVLNNDLSTKTAHDLDRFTLTVREPAAYRNAVIEGYVTNVDRSGRLAGRANITLNFDRIRMPNGRTYDFAGVLQNVTGEDVRVDNEGVLQEEDSQTKSTVERTAIGTAVGALIGAIAGGGKGAAIGAAVGAGAGAGSVYVQGRDDLELSTGTQLTILATAPRR